VSPRTASQKIDEMLARAGHAREQARLCSDGRSRAFWFTMETQWLSRARNEIDIAEHRETHGGRRTALREQMRERLEREMSAAAQSAEPQAASPREEIGDLRATDAEAPSIAPLQHAEDVGAADAEVPSIAPPQHAEDLGVADAEAQDIALSQYAEDFAAAATDAPTLAAPPAAEESRTTKPKKRSRRQRAEPDVYCSEPQTEGSPEQASVLVLSDYRLLRELRTPLGRS
jgi:hypothetical protein